MKESKVEERFVESRDAIEAISKEALSEANTAIIH